MFPPRLQKVECACTSQNVCNHHLIFSQRKAADVIYSKLVLFITQSHDFIACRLLTIDSGDIVQRLIKMKVPVHASHDAPLFTCRVLTYHRHRKSYCFLLK